MLRSVICHFMGDSEKIRGNFVTTSEWVLLQLTTLCGSSSRMPYYYYYYYCNKISPHAKFNMKIILVHSFPVLCPKTKDTGPSKILPPIYQVTSCGIPWDSTSLAEKPSFIHQHPEKLESLRFEMHHKQLLQVLTRICSGPFGQN